MSFMDIEGPCWWCKTRPATQVWAESMNDANHGNYAWVCQICSLEKRLKHARERAAQIRSMEIELEALRAAEINAT